MRTLFVTVDINNDTLIGAKGEEIKMSFSENELPSTNGATTLEEWLDEIHQTAELRGHSIVKVEWGESDE